MKKLLANGIGGEIILMTKQPACAGCYTQYQFPINVDYDTKIPIYSPYLGLTDNEKLVLKHLGEAWNSFINIAEGKHPDHNHEFKDAIHRCQHIIAIRVAQRINPEVWYKPEMGGEAAL
jgi:hypothetical protein